MAPVWTPLETRVIVLDGDPWFVAADVCCALTIGNNRDAIARLDDEEKGVAIIDTLGGAQEMTIVNESGLYALILTSRKPEAKKFKKWVTAEVLPAIRKTGRYDIGASQIDPASLSRLDLIKIAMEAETERLALEARIRKMEPKIDGFDQLFVASDVCAVLEIVNPTRALSRLDDDEKGLHTVKTLGGDQQSNIVNESGLFALILIAERFGKLHKNVIQVIKGLDCSAEFAELNFKLFFQNNALQNGKPRPYYEMTREGLPGWRTTSTDLATTAYRP